MYIPPHFEVTELPAIHDMIRACGLAQFITATAQGLRATPLPLFIVADEGPFGTLYGHLARANDQWKAEPIGDALATFAGPDAYITPSWYTTKADTAKVVPTRNYATVHAHGTVEFFDDTQRILDVVTRLTNLHEGKRAEPWQVSDAPADFIHGQLRGIVGIRMPITRLEGKRKMSQNRTEADRIGVIEGLAPSQREADRAVAALVPGKGR